MNQLQTHWKNLELILQDSLQFSDNEIVILWSTWIEKDRVRRHYMSPICETSVNGIRKYSYDDNSMWVNIDPSTVTTITADGNIVTYGSGSMGNEGFVALTTKDNELIWAFFCTTSNPFIQAEIKDDKIFATTELGDIYIISLENPVKIDIIVLPENEDYR